jgi:serine/threonine protein kinase
MVVIMDGGRHPGLPVVPGLENLTVLARGGHATVYRATQAKAYREVAVKVENGTLDVESDQRRFVREARAAGQMSSHPNVVDLYDVGVTDDGHPYLIMELCVGSYEKRMPVDAAEASLVGAKIADALARAHTAGVLHRDVKPGNILITQFGEPVLADFGLAVIAQSREASITLELTPAYAAPEMFSSPRPLPASDVYALCATLYALIGGKPPRWRENNAMPSLATIMDLFAERIPDLPAAPAELSALLRRGMSNDPGQRPSAAVLRDELLRRDPDPTLFMRQVPGQARASGFGTGPGEEPTQPTVRVP